MLSLVISSEKKDSPMHTKIQWNMSQNCEQAGEAFVLPEGGFRNHALPDGDVNAFSGLQSQNT